MRVRLLSVVYFNRFAPNTFTKFCVVLVSYLCRVAGLQSSDSYSPYPLCSLFVFVAADAEFELGDASLQTN